MIVFGSRGSDLALTQTRMVADSIKSATGEDYRVEVIVTKGDRILDKPLPLIGGKGLFTAELEAALADGKIDAVVHSMKDLPVEDAPGLCVGAVPPRVAVNDVLVFDPRFEDTTEGTIPLRSGARVGTSSHRRRSALRTLRKDLEHADIRGNVPTRVNKVRSGDYAGVMLAAAGLDRLQLDLGGLRRLDLPVEHFTPAPAQGALAVQCRADDERVLGLLAHVHDQRTARCVHAERELLASLGGGCSMPLGALLTTEEYGFRLRAALFDNPETHPDGGHGVFLELRGDEPLRIAVSAAERLRPLIGDPLQGQHVCLLRPGGAGGELAAHLAVAGARVDTVALTEVLPVHPDPAELRDWLRTPCLAFTSARAVSRLVEEAAESATDLRGKRAFAGGPATAEALRQRGIPCEAPVAGAGGGAALARHMLQAGITGGDLVLFPCAEDRHGDFERILTEAGIAVKAVPLYRTVPLTDVDLSETEHDIVVFTSPSAVRVYASLSDERRGQHVALGETTAAAMNELGVRLHGTARRPTPTALIDLIQELHHARPPATPPS